MKASLTTLLPFLACIATGYKTGIIGYGQLWYDPPCAYACRAVIGNAPLECPSIDHSNMDMGGHSHGGSPMAPCIADNDAFLLTLAHCLSTRCAEIPASKLEAYWGDQTTGDKSIDAKWTYGAALANVEQPKREYIAGETLNYTALISDESYQYQYDFNVHFDWEETVQSTFVIVLIAVGVATPVFLSVITYLPFMTTAVARIKPYLICPSTIGDYNIRPLPYLLGNAPTMGSGLWIAMFVILNIILGAVSYKSFSHPHPWGFTKSAEILAYVGYRTGHISFALLPLTVLFSSRNNILLWITNWHFSTFLVLHRWVARLCAIHAIIHSITLLAAYVSLETYYADVHKPYWIWGIVGTLCLLLLLFQSVLWIRRASYEAFLILHILLTLFVVVSCWYHIYYWKPYSGIYELWIYMVCVVWFFDRLFRVLRVAKNGMRRATIVELSNEIVRLDISGVRWLSAPGYHAYVYFPTLQPLRAWQNHPFSVNNSALLQKSIPSTEHLSNDKDVELNRTAPQITVSQKATGTDSISIYIKKHRGTTSLLTKRTCLPVLLEGPYGGPSRDVLKCDRVLLVGGGIGITGLLSWAQAHVNVKLAWSLKESSQALFKDLETSLSGINDKTVLVGERLDVKALLEQEVEAGWKKVGVVVCGPAGLCDSVRAAVVSMGKTSGVVFELEVDAFSW